MTNIIILTKIAKEITKSKKNGAGTTDPNQRTFLSKM